MYILFEIQIKTELLMHIIIWLIAIHEHTNVHILVHLTGCNILFLSIFNLKILPSTDKLGKIFLWPDHPSITRRNCRIFLLIPWSPAKRLWRVPLVQTESEQDISEWSTVVQILCVPKSLYYLRLLVNIQLLSLFSVADIFVGTTVPARKPSSRNGCACSRSAGSPCSTYM